LTVVAERAVAVASDAVLVCADIRPQGVRDLLARFGMVPVMVDQGLDIPGSYWGVPEAGLIADRLYFRSDTPAHSLLHELAHYICMDPVRRSGLQTNAGGDDEEECAVCFLEILLADHLEPFDAERCLDDMDRWGYSFRQGSARAWFQGDGRAARDWLIAHRLIDAQRQLCWRLRD
jgi:hypothetical protein